MPHPTAAASSRPADPTPASSTAGRPRRNRLTAWDGALMLAGFVYALVLTAVHSRGRIFWEDEMLGWMLLHDPSWRHMISAWNAGADGGGFTFYLLGRGWFHLFGPSPLSFRLFSTTCFGLAFAATWAALRRFYSRGIVAFALFNTWFFSPQMVAHMQEGRFYGLLVLGVSLALWLTLVLAETPRPTPKRLYLALFAVHALLTTSHLLGVAFSAFLLGALVVLDLLARRRRPLLWLAGAASWLLLIPERANIVASAAVGKPHFWTRRPTLETVFNVYTGSCKEIGLVLALLLMGAAIALLQTPRGPRTAIAGAWQTRRPVWIVLAAMLLIPAGFFVEGLLTGTWLFNDRYLLPVTVAAAVLTAELLCLLATNLRLLTHLPRTARPVLAVAAAAVFIAALLSWDFRHLKNFSFSPRDYTAQLTAMLPKGVPAVCEDAFCFAELIGRQHSSGVSYMFLLDWRHSISPGAPRGEVMQFHLMRNWRNAGYFSGSIQPIDEFLRDNPRFFVIHTGPAVPNNIPPDLGNPLAGRLAHDPGYQVEPYGHVDYIEENRGLRDTISLVCRVRCPASQS